MRLGPLPLIQSLRTLKLKDDCLTVVFYGLILFICFLLVLTPLVPHVQELLMSKFHLATGSVELWALLQFIPSMYNFGNEIWISQRPLTWDMINEGQWGKDVDHRWVNHYPLRILFFGDQRKYFKPGIYFIYIRSQYRAQVLRSSFRMVVDGNRLSIERLEDLSGAL